MVTLYATWPLGSRLAQIFPRMLRSLTTRTGLSLFCPAAPFRPPLFFFAMVEAFREWSDRGTGLRDSNCVGDTETCTRVFFPGDQPAARKGGWLPSPRAGRTFRHLRGSRHGARPRVESSGAASARIGM